MANPNTAINVGLRKNFTTLGDRNFEPDGTVQYKANREPLEFLGGIHHAGNLLPFDGNNAYTPGTVALLQKYWDAGFISPAT